MSETIVLIFEGARTEPRILSSILRVFFANNPNRIVHAPYDTDLYDLYDEVRSDEALDIIELLRERNERNGERLEGLDIDDISQIFLFFDYDGHATKATDEKIEEMVSFFDNETEEGKLYVSYPMVESLKDFGDTHSNETNFVEAKRPIGYKKLVGDRTKYHDYRKLDRPIWNYITIENLKKANLIVNDHYDLPSEQEELGQEEIFENQLQKYIVPRGEVGVLSAFPFFITEYFGRSIINSL